MHNHADSHCWLAVLDGGVREVQYQPRATAPDGLAPQPGAVYVEQTHAADMKVRDAAGRASMSAPFPRSPVLEDAWLPA